MKEYKLVLPKSVNQKSKEILEYLCVKHYEDGVLSSGACAILLGIEKYDFQTRILNKYSEK